MNYLTAKEANKIATTKISNSKGLREFNLVALEESTKGNFSWYFQYQGLFDKEEELDPHATHFYSLSEEEENYIREVLGYSLVWNGCCLWYEVSTKKDESN